MDTTKNIRSLWLVIAILMSGLFFQEQVQAQTTVRKSVAGPENELHFSRIELKRKKKQVFDAVSRDSTLVVYVDTLIMKDRSSLQFYGLKNVKLVVKHAEIDDRAFFSGISGENNASSFDIDIHLAKLGSLYVIARGEDAMNGTKTFPNGDGGDVQFVYSTAGIQPQTTNRKDDRYLHVDAAGGGRATNAYADLNRIYTQIRTSGGGLRGVPQGQIYSGSPGRDGKVTIRAK